MLAVRFTQSDELTRAAGEYSAQCVSFSKFKGKLNAQQLEREQLYFRLSVSQYATYQQNKTRVRVTSILLPFLPRFIRWSGETGQKSTDFRLEQPPKPFGFTRMAEVST